MPILYGSNFNHETRRYESTPRTSKSTSTASTPAPTSTPTPTTTTTSRHNPTEAPNEALRSALRSTNIEHSNSNWRHIGPNTSGQSGSLNIGALNEIALRNLKLAEGGDGGGGTSSIAVDNGTSREDEKKTQKEIKYQSERAPLDLSYLQESEQFAKRSLKEGERGIDANFDVLRRGMEASQGRETGAMSAGLARAGGYLGFTGSGESMMVSLEKSHRSEILDLEAKRTQSLSEARQAYNDQMYDVAREKQKLATQYEREQYEEKQRYFAEVKRIQQEEAEKDEQSRVNMEIYNALQLDGVKDEMDVFGALQGKASPEQIANFFKTVTPKTTKSDLFKPSNTQTAMLMGAGFGADDIQTIYDHLNESGYDDVLKASLTPYQRRVMDDMLTMKPEKVKEAKEAKVPEYKFTATDRKKLVSAGLTFDEITNIQRDIAEYGIDAVLEGLEVDPTVFPGIGTVEDMIRRISTDQTERRKEEGAKARAGGALNEVFDSGSDEDEDEEMNKKIEALFK